MNNIPSLNRISLYSDKCAVHRRAFQFSLAVGVFFLLACALLQWPLASGPAYQADGLPRDFVELEAIVCAVAAVLAALHAGIHAILWRRLAPRSPRAARARRPALLRA